MSARPPSSPQRRTLVLVPGSRELGYAHGLGPSGPGVELIYWGVRSVPRSEQVAWRVRFAQSWLETVIVSQRIDQVALVLPDRWHLQQAKNPTRLPLMVAGLRHQVSLMSCPLVLRDRQELKGRFGRPRLPVWALAVPPRARWAIALLGNITREGL